KKSASAAEGAFAAVFSWAPEPHGRARSSRPARPGSARNSSGSRRLRILSPGGTPAVLPLAAEKRSPYRSYYCPGMGGSRKGLARCAVGTQEAGRGASGGGVGLTIGTSARQCRLFGYPCRRLVRQVDQALVSPGAHAPRGHQGTEDL